MRMQTSELTQTIRPTTNRANTVARFSRARRVELCCDLLLPIELADELAAELQVADVG